MQKEWTSFRITILLYFILLILPLSFYFVHISFKTMQNDTKMAHQSSFLGSTIKYLAVNSTDQNNLKMIDDVDKILHETSLWVTQNNNSKLYIGSQTLSKDFSQLNSCWTSYKESLSTHNDTLIKQHGLQCYELANNMAIIIEKMVYLKQKKIINTFYGSLVLAMILILFVIYMVRIYIHRQMKKHTIYDHATKLFNKKYFLAELKISCARAIRHNHPLSIVSISIDNFAKGNKRYDNKTREHILKILGGLITSLTRVSDVACRYDENHFSILLPDTQEENALVLEKRIREALERHDFDVIPELNFKFTIAHLNDKESPEAFTARIKELLA